MGRFSQWISGLVERAFCGRRDLYAPDEDLRRVVAYMEPGYGKRRRRAVRRRERTKTNEKNKDKV